MKKFMSLVVGAGMLFGMTSVTFGQDFFEVPPRVIQLISEADFAGARGRVMIANQDTGFPPYMQYNLHGLGCSGWQFIAPFPINVEYKDEFFAIYLRIGARELQRLQSFNTSCIGSNHDLVVSVPIMIPCSDLADLAKRRSTW